MPLTCPKVHGACRGALVAAEPPRVLLVSLRKATANVDWASLMATSEGKGLGKAEQDGRVEVRIPAQGDGVTITRPDGVAGGAQIERAVAPETEPAAKGSSSQANPTDVKVSIRVKKKASF